jgi:hypothetical protein
MRAQSRECTGKACERVGPVAVVVDQPAVTRVGDGGAMTKTSS